MEELLIRQIICTHFRNKIGSGPTAHYKIGRFFRKSCKGSPILIAWFLMTFYVLMYAVDMQLFWLSIAYTVLTVIFGPMLFFLHTHIYVAVNCLLFIFGNVYNM